MDKPHITSCDHDHTSFFGTPGTSDQLHASKKMKIDEIIEHLSKKEIGIQKEFIRSLSFNVTIAFRSIIYDDKLSEKDKLESMTHINEFQHHILNNIEDLPDELFRLKDVAKSYAKKNERTAGELGAIINSALNSCKRKEKKEKTQMKFIIITGPPYSGKGTQCDELVKKYGLTHISTGEQIRTEKEEKSELGKIMSDFDEKGELVPDKIMKQLLDKLIEENKNASGIILDGYPRTIPQIHDLQNVLKSKNISIDNIINIEVPNDELLKRAKKRAETSTREDDKNPETHYKRIRVFEEQTKPTIEYMKNEFQVNSFDGLGTIEKITERIIASM